MHEQLEEAVRDYLRLEEVTQEKGRAIIKQCSNSPTRFFKESKDLAEFYLANEKAIKEFLVDQGEQQIEDIEDAVLYVFETICEEMEEKAATVDEYNEYDDEWDGVSAQ